MDLFVFMLKTSKAVAAPYLSEPRSQSRKPATSKKRELMAVHFFI